MSFGSCTFTSTNNNDMETESKFAHELRKGDWFNTNKQPDLIEVTDTPIAHGGQVTFNQGDASLMKYSTVHVLTTPQLKGEKR